MKTVVVDLDGTLSICDHRTHYITDVPNPDWNAFFEACDRDEPNKPLIELLHTLDENDDIKIRIFSGRSDAVREKTIAWLKKHDVPYQSLFMRYHEDHRPDEILKEEWLDMILQNGDRVLCSFDDRQKVVDMWRRRGILCNQVAPGNF